MRPVKQLPGVVDAFLVEGNGKVEELLDGVAIVGTSTWAVFNAKRSLEVRWDETAASKDSWSEAGTADARALEGTRGGTVTLEKGDVASGVCEDPANSTFEAFLRLRLRYSPLPRTHELHGPLSGMVKTVHGRFAGAVDSDPVPEPEHQRRQHSVRRRRGEHYRSSDAPRRQLRASGIQRVRLRGDRHIQTRACACEAHLDP